MSATDTSPDAAPAPAPAPAAVDTTQLGIEGMHCASCVARVERELRAFGSLTVVSNANRLRRWHPQEER